MGNFSIYDWIKIILNSKSLLILDEFEAKCFQLYVVIVCDQIWMTRNKTKSEGKCSNPLELSRQILRSYEEHEQVGMATGRVWARFLYA